MRTFCALSALAVAVVLTACAPQERQGCFEAVESEIAFSGAQTSDDLGPDSVEAASSGPSCSRAVITLTIRANDGEPLWAYAAPAAWVFPELAAAGEISASRDAVRAALTRWSRLSIATTAAEPAFQPFAAAPGAPNAEQAAAAGIDLAAAGEGPWSTRLDAATYSDIRARALPMACYETGPDTASCIYFEPALGHAAHFVDFER